MKHTFLSPTKIQGGLLCLATFALLYYPKETANAVTQGLLLCFQVLIPALFPFFIISSLVIDLGLCHGISQMFGKLMYPLFRLSPSCSSALLLGFVGGYPVGAKTAISLYENKLCTQDEAQRLLAFSNNAGPGFILSVIGAGIFHSGKAGCLLYAVHFISCILVGILVGWLTPQGKTTPPTENHAPPPKAMAFLPAFLSAVKSAMDSTFHICAFLLCFSVVIELLILCGILPFLASLLPWDMAYALPLLIGTIELSSGVKALSLATDPGLMLPLFGFMLGFAGLSVHCQVLAFAQPSKLSMKPYLWGNFLQGLLSALLLWCLSPLILPLVVETMASQAVVPFPLYIVWGEILFFSFLFTKNTRNLP